MSKKSIPHPASRWLNALSRLAMLAAASVCWLGVSRGSWLAPFGLVLFMTTAMIRAAYFGIDDGSVMSHGEGNLVSLPLESAHASRKKAS